MDELLEVVDESIPAVVSRVVLGEPGDGSDFRYREFHDFLHVPISREVTIHSRCNVPLFEEIPVGAAPGRD
jgi:hypothetical protein